MVSKCIKCMYIVIIQLFSVHDGTGKEQAKFTMNDLRAIHS